jgi:hypothetical protein
LSDCGWQLRLYSYDSSTDGSEVYKVRYLNSEGSTVWTDGLQVPRLVFRRFCGQFNGLQVLRLIFRRFYRYAINSKVCKVPAVDSHSQGLKGRPKVNKIAGT